MVCLFHQKGFFLYGDQDKERMINVPSMPICYTSVKAVFLLTFCTLTFYLRPSSVSKHFLIKRGNISQRNGNFFFDEQIRQVTGTGSKIC